jgi:1-deoxy-D-xylulose-5-phosphate reductoisomerase
VAECLAKVDYVRNPGYEDYVNTDKETRIRASELVRR